MPRALRIEYPGALYHIMSRGNHLERIFKDNTDRSLLLKTLGEAAKSSGWTIHSFVFMSNHYHLLIETHRPTLVKGMQYLNSTYTRRYNLRHKTFGHLLQGRYKALLIDPSNPNYFLTISNYIHLNPIRARIIQEPKELWKDPWNSAGWIAAKRAKAPDWLKWQRVYAELGHTKRSLSAIRDYRQHLLQKAVDQQNPHQYQKIRRGWCLGSEQFIQEMKDKLHELSRKITDRESWNNEAVDELEQDRATRLLKTGAKSLGYSSGAQVTGIDRILISRWLRLHTKVPVKWLARQFGLQTRGGMSSSIYLIGKQIEADSSLRARWIKLNRSIS